MNVMAQAHELTKARIASGTIYSYAELMKRHLIQAHKEYKVMQTQTPKTIKLSLIGATLEADKDATWFSLEGTAVSSEGNSVHVNESGGSSLSVQASADWYFCTTNGFTNVDLYVCVWGLEDVKESFKVVK